MDRREFLALMSSTILDWSLLMPQERTSLVEDLTNNTVEVYDFELPDPNDAKTPRQRTQHAQKLKNTLTQIITDKVRGETADFVRRTRLVYDQTGEEFARRQMNEVEADKEIHEEFPGLKTRIGIHTLTPEELRKVYQKARNNPEKFEEFIRNYLLVVPLSTNGVGKGKRPPVYFFPEWYEQIRKGKRNARNAKERNIMMITDLAEEIVHTAIYSEGLIIDGEGVNTKNAKKLLGMPKYNYPTVLRLVSEDKAAEYHAEMLEFYPRLREGIMPFRRRIREELASYEAQYPKLKEL